MRQLFFEDFQQAYTAVRELARKTGDKTYIMRLTPTSTRLAVLRESQFIQSFPAARKLAGFDRRGVPWDSECCGMDAPRL